MMYKRSDFQIIFHDLDEFSIKVRKPFLKFFKIWVPITYQEAENSEELILTFETFEAATDFIENIVD